MDRERQPGAMGRRILRLRTEQGYRTPASFADAAGVDRDVVRDLENGDRATTSPENMIAIASALGITVDRLIAPNDDFLLIIPAALEVKAWRADQIERIRARVKDALCAAIRDERDRAAC